MDLPGLEDTDPLVFWVKALDMVGLCYSLFYLAYPHRQTGCRNTYKSNNARVENLYAANQILCGVGKILFLILSSNKKKEERNGRDELNR